MTPALLIAFVNAAIELAPKGISLYQQVREMLATSDEPEAKELLEKFEATYVESAAEADEALRRALDKLPPEA